MSFISLPFISKAGNQFSEEYIVFHNVASATQRLSPSPLVSSRHSSKFLKVNCVDTFFSRMMVTLWYRNTVKANKFSLERVERVSVLLYVLFSLDYRLQ